MEIKKSMLKLQPYQKSMRIIVIDDIFDGNHLTKNQQLKKWM